MILSKRQAMVFFLIIAADAYGGKLRFFLNYTQYGSVSLFTLRRSPQPPLKRGANFVGLPPF